MDDRSMADALIAAERTRTPIAPFTAVNPFLAVERAYRIQTLVVAHRIASGEQVIGWKLGMTSRAKRHALGIREPVHATLTSGMAHPADVPIAVDELIHPVAEPELALVIGAEIALPATLEGVLAAVVGVRPAIEVFDSRYTDRFMLADSIADNAGAARVVFGAAELPVDRLPGLHVLGCVFSVDGEIAATVAGGAAMGHPGAAVAWLANALASRGEQLPPGSVVLTGGLTRAVPLRAGRVITAEFDGLGAVEVRGAHRAAAGPGEGARR